MAIKLRLCQLYNMAAALLYIGTSVKYGKASAYTQRLTHRQHAFVQRSPPFSSSTFLSSSANQQQDPAATRVVSISDAYDGGNIQLIETRQEDDRLVVSLAVKPDPYTELETTTHLQYFSFRSTVNLPEQQPSLLVEYVIENAGNTSFAKAWEEATVFYSTSITDSDSWRRNIRTTYQMNGKLTWQHAHDASSGSIYFCYFPTFSYSRHLDLIQACYSSPVARVETLGQSLEGREMECVTIGTGERIAWIIHRQHPGEHMAEYYAEGLLMRLLSESIDDETVRKVLSLYTFHIVPNMNPDGGVRGYLRTNAGGANLNREWANTSEHYKAPSSERSPEVYCVLDKMKNTGCDVFVDVHGDEVLPFNFLAQPTVPNWGKRLESLHGAFAAAYERSNSDMQRNFGYEAYNQPCSASKVLRVASSQVAARFDCLSVTLEMPFNDCLSNPDPERGWSPARAQKLGASLLEPLQYIHPYLRANGEFWEGQPDDDAYVRPTSNYKS